jgi:tetratricopeptide (TPR) repeat protein
VELIRALGMPEAAAASVESTAAAASSGAEQKNPRARKKWSAGKRALIIGACVLGALCLGAGGYWYYNDSMYNQAIACIGRQDYTKGVDDLKQILSIYKASGKYMAYACAGNALQSNQFDNARGLFKSLGGFNGADKMLTEVDYQQALYLLTQGNFDQSKAMFAALGSYKDSAQMMLECDYQKAVAQLQNGEFQNAIDGFTALAKSSYKDSANMALEAKYEYAIDTAKRADLENAYQMFKNLGLYKDSAQNMSIVAETLYEKAVNYYHINAYTKALLLFKLITPYQYSDSYILLISVHFCSIDFADLTTLDYLSNRLETLGNFEDAAILNDEIVATIINRLKYR